MVPLPKNPRFINLTGQRFGRLIVIEFLGQRSHQSIWKCHCDCGKDTHVAKGELLNGDTQSCGCLRNSFHIIHGRSKTPEFLAWDAMIQRCTNPHHPQYQNYGGRGIMVCEQWLNAAYFLHDVGKRPGPKYSLERINNNGPYSPENVRWALQSEQMRNTRRTVLVTIQGITRCLTDWAALANIPIANLRYRLKHRWPEHELLIPVVKGVKHIRHPKL